jgi:hypothetical protein
MRCSWFETRALARVSNHEGPDQAAMPHRAPIMKTS